MMLLKSWKLTDHHAQETWEFKLRDETKNEAVFVKLSPTMGLLIQGATGNVKCSGFKIFPWNNWTSKLRQSPVHYACPQKRQNRVFTFRRKRSPMPSNYTSRDSEALPSFEYVSFL